MTALKYWLWLTSRKGMDAQGVQTVLDYFITPERAYYADPEEYGLVPLRPAARRGLLDRELGQADAILADCQRLDVSILTFQDAHYPQRLRQLADPPAVLYVKGRMFHFDEEVAIGVVGAREPSGYGKMAAEKLGLELAGGGALVVSGIAQGIDAHALRGALKAGGPAVSVLACGADVCYPRENRFLYQDVAAAGALISEYPPGTRPDADHFPRRNRILSGLCLGVLAVECRPYGGTISTVNHALEQNRDVFAVPGAIDAPMSDGTNRLIRQGATLVTCGRDVLEAYRDRFPAKLGRSAPLTPEAARARLEGREEDVPAPAAKEVREEEPARERVPLSEQRSRFTDDELAVLAALGGQVRTADQVVELTQIPARRVLSALTMLQVQGAVEEQLNRRFSALVELEED